MKIYKTAKNVDSLSLIFQKELMSMAWC
jgi:hypothetical protein